MAPASKRSHGTGNPETIFAVRFSAMGDVLIAIPVIYSVCRRWPDVRVVFITKRPFDKLLVNAPANLTVVTFDLKGKEHSALGAALKTGKLIEEYHPTAMADLHGVIRTKAMDLMCRAKGVKVAAIDKGRNEKRQLTKLGASRYGQKLKSSSQRYADVFAEAGYAPEENAASVIPRTRAADDVPRIGIAPFAAHEGKAYPSEEMAKVVAQLTSEGCKIWLFGAPGREQEILDSWAAKSPETTVSVPTLNPGLDGELKLMSSLDVMVAMDSGNMHMASVAGVPTVSVWGATHPYAGFAAPTATEELRVQRDMTCRPCSVFGNKPCRLKDTPYQCLNSITPEMIIEKVHLALKNKTGTTHPN